MVSDIVTPLMALSHDGHPMVVHHRNALSLLFDDVTIQSEMRADAPDALVLGYTQSMMGVLLFKPEPTRVGMIGLGGGSLTKFCYRHLTRTTIEVAEIDPQVIALRRQFQIPDDNDRLQVHCLDGAHFVREARHPFDILMVDGFDRQGQPASLCSQPFYDDCHGALAAEGIMVVNLLSDAPGSDIYIDRIHRAFDGAIAVVDALDSMNRIVFACKGKALDADEATLRRRARQLALLYPADVSLVAQNILVKRPRQTVPKTALPVEQP